MAFRNMLAHGYAALDHRRVYDAAATHAPQLIDTLQKLLAKFPASDF